MAKTFEEGFRAGLRRAEKIAVATTDADWSDNFSRHGNKGIATMRGKLGRAIESAIHAEWEGAEAG
jgi:hypothetical protein